MSNLRHFKHYQWIAIIVAIGVVFRKHGGRFRFLHLNCKLVKIAAEKANPRRLTLPFDISHRGDSGMNQTARIWMTGQIPCTRVGTRHDHWLPLARANAPKHTLLKVSGNPFASKKGINTHAETMLPIYQQELNMAVILPRCRGKKKLIIDCLEE